MNPAIVVALLLLVAALASALGWVHDRLPHQPGLDAEAREQRARATLCYFTDVHDSA